MLKIAPARFAIGLLSLLVLGVFLAPRPASASGMALTLDSTGPFTVFTGNSVTLNFTLTNNSGEDLIVSGAGEGDTVSVVGNQSDTISGITLPIFFGSEMLGSEMLASGSSVDFSVTFLAAAPTNTVPEFGINSLFLGLAGCPVDAPDCNGSTSIQSNFVDFTITVDSPAPTPEPSSLLLLGTGLLGLFAAARLAPVLRRFAHS